MGDLQPLFGVPTGTDCIENDGKTGMPDQRASTEQACSQLTVTTGGIDFGVMNQAISCLEGAQTSVANITPSDLYSIPNAAAVPCLNAVPPVLAPAIVIQEGLGPVIPNPLGNPSGPGLNGFGMQGIHVSPQGATPNPLPQPAISLPSLPASSPALAMQHLPAAQNVPPPAQQVLLQIPPMQVATGIPRFQPHVMPAPERVATPRPVQPVQNAELQTVMQPPIPVHANVNCCPLRNPKCISGSNNNLLHNQCPLCNPRCNNNINSNQLRNSPCMMHFNKLYNNGLCVIEWPHLCPQYRR